MSDSFYFSNILLWLVVLATAYSMLAILRHNIEQTNKLHQDHMGLSYGAKFPIDEHPALRNEQRPAVDMKKDGTVAFMTSCYCDACKRLFPVLNDLQKRMPMYRFVIFMSGPLDEVTKALFDYELDIPVIQVDDFSKFQTSIVPFGFFLSAEGIIQAKGVVNTENHIQTLISKGVRRRSA